MTPTISRSSAILGAARTLAAKLLLAIPIDRAALTQAMTESAIMIPGTYPATNNTSIGVPPEISE